MREKSIISDNNVKFSIIETDEEFIVEAKVPKRRVAGDVKVRCDIKDVKGVLSTIAEISSLTLSESPSEILTNSKNQHLNGRWIFEKPKNQKKQHKSPRVRKDSTDTISQKKEDIIDATAEETTSTAKSTSPRKKSGTSFRERTRAIANKREKVQE